MKILSSKAGIALSILLSGLSFIVTNSYANYTSSQPAINQNSKAFSLLHPPTDITVVNASSNLVYAVVPGLNVRVVPGYNIHIYNDDPNVGYTWITLQDPNYFTFYSNSVCKLAIITVYGNPGNYRVNTDSDLCI